MVGGPGRVWAGHAWAGVRDVLRVFHASRNPVRDLSFAMKSDSVCERGGGEGGG